ncbi:MAG: hypothetical protein EXS39_02790 [Opitutaceae bacterium]|nr:hypothetical protein [Opitutaceae bacterium]
MTLRRLFLLLLLPVTTQVFAKEETLIIFQERRVTIAVPEGYVYSSNRDESGVISAKISDSKQRVDLVVSFYPDPKGRLASEDKQMGFVAEMSQPYAEGSAEKSYDFRPLEPHTGSGTYSVFTDASLVGKMPFPPGEFLNITCGVKAWPGCVLVFKLWSNSTTSTEYETALKLLKMTFEEKPAGKTL